MKSLVHVIVILLLCARVFAGDSLPLLLADPTIIRHKGLYYAYGTAGGNADKGIPVYTSKDMQSWKAGGMALKVGDSYGTKGFWAPQVFSYQKKFYMAYTANENIAIAVSDNPGGPFKQQKLQALPADKRMIDPFVLFDGGKIYLYHVRLDEGNRIFVTQLNTALDAFIPGTLQECLHAEKGWEDTQNASWPVSEGPTVIRKNGKYYMFYSCNDFRNPDYAVGIAVSQSPAGPWVKQAGNPFISRKHTGENGSGHGDVVRAGNSWWYVLHTHNTSTKVSPRKTAIIQFNWTGALPELIPGSFTWLTR
ncbi:glycoside hydrolase family 43 protein [uncultured Chitinophaga sp.]|uniref:glycoside hydrolase family 43 protein n=1 Tax=uncultured Chitinophaga sp. TaxID=339340 RepID=UPI0025FCC359|nr:glycoside hydrolase family 43 protein [uncultured Chitinophaga sp.]